MMVTVSPSSTVKLTPSTARMTPLSVISSICRSRTSSSGRGRGLTGLLRDGYGGAHAEAPFRRRIAVTESVTDQIDPDDQQHDDQAGQGHQPPRGGDVVLAVGDDPAPGGERSLRPGAEVAQRALQQHGLGQQQEDHQRRLLDDVGDDVADQDLRLGADRVPGRRPRTVSRARPAPASGSPGRPPATGRSRSPTVITGSDGPNNATTSSSIISRGSDIWASSSRETIDVDVQPPKKPAAEPSTMPIRPETLTARSPMASETCPPCKISGQQVAAQRVGAEQVAVGERWQPAGGRDPAHSGSGSGSTWASSDGNDDEQGADRARSAA